jgi:hypothetical protein
MENGSITKHASAGKEEVKDIWTAVTHKTRVDGCDWTHSLTISMEYMDQILAWSESVCPKRVLLRGSFEVY